MLDTRVPSHGWPLIAIAIVAAVCLSVAFTLRANRLQRQAFEAAQRARARATAAARQASSPIMPTRPGAPAPLAPSEKDSKRASVDLVDEPPIFEDVERRPMSNSKDGPQPVLLTSARQLDELLAQIPHDAPPKQVRQFRVLPRVRVTGKPGDRISKAGSSQFDAGWQVFRLYSSFPDEGYTRLASDGTITIVGELRWDSSYIFRNPEHVATEHHDGQVVPATFVLADYEVED